MATTVSIDDLPPEIFQLILSKLSFPERKIARQVNKHWLAACNSAKFTKNELLKIKLNDLQSVTVTRGFLNVVIEYWVKGSTVRQIHDEFWEDHGDSIRSLQVRHSNLPYPILEKIIDHCPNLTHLSLVFLLSNNFFIDSYDEAVATNAGLKSDSLKLEFLTSLSLYGEKSFSLITVAGLLKLAHIAPNLKRLELEYIHKADESCAKAIMALISKQAHVLNELIFKECRIATYEFLKGVLDLIGPQLTVLTLDEYAYNNWALKSASFLKEHTEKFSNLKSLTIRGFHLAEGDSLNWVAQFQNLEFISFSNTHLRDRDLIHLVELQHLKGLNIYCTRCSAAGISNCFGGKPYPNMIALQVSYLTDAVLSTILPNLPNLKFLDVGYSDKVSPTGIQHIITHCTHLTHLSIEHCSNMLDVIDPVSINAITNLVYLSLNACYNLKSSNIGQLCFEKLKLIVLSRVSFSEDEIKDLMKNCPKLERVLVFFHNRTYEDWEMAKLFDYSFHQITIFDFASNKI